MGNRNCQDVWDDFAAVDYVSPQPGISERWNIPRPMRADNDPSLAQQPWYHGSFFAAVDPTRTQVNQTTGMGVDQSHKGPAPRTKWRGRQ